MWEQKRNDPEYGQGRGYPDMCETLAHGLIGLIGHPYQKVATSFLLSLKGTLG